MRNLQRQLSNGNWWDCDDQTEAFLVLCEKNNGPHESGSGEIAARCCATRDATRDEVLAALEAGKKLRNDGSDWYSNCRYEPAPAVEIDVEMARCSCGHSVPHEQVMSASLGTSCPDCYDRMSA